MCGVPMIVVTNGKTTLVDQLLKLSGTFRIIEQIAERAMDSNAIENVNVNLLYWLKIQPSIIRHQGLSSLWIITPEFIPFQW